MVILEIMREPCAEVARGSGATGVAASLIGTVVVLRMAAGAGLHSCTSYMFQGRHAGVRGAHDN
jgi:hypothetical protein